MSAHEEIKATQIALRDLLASGQLSEPLQKRAAQLIARIENPVRLGVFGLPGSGKSALLNLLLGEDVLPDGVRLPTTSLSFGETALATCTLNDGSRQVIEGGDLREAAALHPAFVEAQLPLPALSKLSMLEVVAGDHVQEQQRALQWASKRVDMALWCSRANFDAAEQDIWGVMPEKILDHSFLLLTNFDDPLAGNAHSAHLGEAARNGDDFFKQILPIAPRAALAAKTPNGGVDKEKMRSAGAIDLISAILREVQIGKQGAIDQAEMFLCQVDFAPAREQPVAARTDETGAEPLAEDVPPAIDETPEVDAGLAAEPQDQPQLADGPGAEVIPLSPQSKQVLEQAVEQLTAEGEVLLANFTNGDLENAAIVETCVDTVTWLADYMSESGSVSDPAFDTCKEAALDAAELAQLIQLEKGDGVASDLLCLMVQLKQDMATTLAA